MRFFVGVFLFATVAFADDPVGDKLFPPDLIMEHQKELGLDGAAVATMMNRIQEFQSSAVKMQFELKAATETLLELLTPTTVDETRAVAAAMKVMGLEQELKRAHLQLLIRLKNALTLAQQEKLRAVRSHQ